MKISQFKSIILGFLGLSTFLILIILPILVSGINNQWDGYRINKNSEEQLIGLSAVGDTRNVRCVRNDDYIKDFFIPTRTTREWQMFQTNKPNVTILDDCCGDDECTGAETFANCPIDCDPPTVDPPDPPLPSCYKDSDCIGPDPGWGNSWTCQGQTVMGFRGTRACSGGNCIINWTYAGYRTCGGGENSRCRHNYSTCFNYCTDGEDNDGDGYRDAKDTDCNGCGGYECSSGVFCNTTTNCYINGGDCGGGKVWVAGQCQCPPGPNSTDYGDFCGSPCFGHDSLAGAYARVTGSCPPATIVCQRGSYNPPGVGQSCRPCPAGTYCESVSCNSCAPCPAGYTCPRGIRIPCPSGMTSEEGGSCYYPGT